MGLYSTTKPRQVCTDSVTNTSLYCLFISPDINLRGQQKHSGKANYLTIKIVAVSMHS